MAKNPKQKGNRFEAQTAQMLSERFKPLLGVEKGFRRNIDSGSFYGGSNTHRMESHNLDYAIFGDIVCPREFRFIIECKHYATAPNLATVFAGSKQWDGWIAEAEHDSNSSEKDWLLVIKYNRVKPLSICRTSTLNNNQVGNTMSYGDNYVVTLWDNLLELDDGFWFE